VRLPRFTAISESFPGITGTDTVLARKRFLSTEFRKGILDLGLLIGLDLPFPEIPSLAPGLAGCRTLLELLKSLCYQSSRLASHARFRLVAEKEAVWLRDEGPSLLDDPADSLQIRLFRILGMIQVVQTVLGKQWRPRRILAACSYNRSIEAAAALGAESMLFDQPYWAIELDRRSLSTSLCSSAVNQQRPAEVPLPPGAPGFTLYPRLDIHFISHR
jgi:hypothetical protein